MKKAFLLVIASLGFGITVIAQEVSENAIGLRIGDRDGFGTEISYQRALGGNNRLEADFGWRSGNNFDGFKLTGIYQWVWAFDGNFNWYTGVGGGVGFYSLKNNAVDNETFVFTSGNIGIEYNFDSPWLFCLDFRPELGLGDFRDGFDITVDFDIALGLRYQF
ncbi:hypothetical protein [Lacinutrix jangbogonensis]|uniref:hypothetical protein n=1 Tax=Lacinutrix jangbogonensis TaxID=1469557 RepID=UPI00053DAB9F|nr:hypothetical protein [Lacinutrix jangbogonensis]